MTTKRWLKILFFTAISLIVLLPSLVALFRKPLVIFPFRETHEIGAITDGYTEGNSQVKTLKTYENMIICEYILREGSKSPVAGFYIRINHGGRFVDLSRYTHLRLKIDSSHANIVRLFLKSFIPGVTSVNNASTYRHLEYKLLLSRGKEEYSIGLDNFLTPSWWYDISRISPEKAGVEDFKNIFSIEFHQSNTPINVTDLMTVTYISFYRSNIPVFLYTLFAGGFCIFLLLIKRRKNSTTEDTASSIPYKHIELLSYRDEDLSRIMELVTARYAEPEFSVWNVQDATGLNNKRISALLKEEFDMTFKQVLNNIRIKEARRLLVETDRKINDIAFIVGYNNITHFNRLFKKLTNMSAKQYRAHPPDSGG